MPIRIGFGTDLHRLEPGDGLWIGGVRVDATRRAVADSDGDVLLHALVDALLGAAGMGDIGTRFPKEKVKKGEASGRFVDEIMAELKTRGMRVANADFVVDLEKPSLAPFKQSIRDNVAKLLAVRPDQVNIKAKSAEGLGPVGEGKAVTAQAALLLEKIG